jgi:CheY-like chemotaxis protein
MARILVVDDEETIRGLLKEVLSDAGHEVCAVGEGIEALRKCYKEEFDLAIIDMVMPGLDGMQTITKLAGSHPMLKIIAISGGDKSFDGNTYLDLVRDKRAHCVFKKPFEREDLLKAVDELTTRERP